MDIIRGFEEEDIKYQKRDDGPRFLTGWTLDDCCLIDEDRVTHNPHGLGVSIVFRRSSRIHQIST